MFDKAEVLADWLRLGTSVDSSILRLVLVDIDGVLTAGEGATAEPALLDRLASWNDAAASDPTVPALSLCSGRPSPYVELLAQLVHAFLPCLFEHGAGMVEPRAFRFTFNPSLGPSPWRPVAALREVLDGLVRSGRVFVQPGKEATLTLYPVGAMTLEELAAEARDAVTRAGSPFRVTVNYRNVELRPPGIDKGAGARRPTRPRLFDRTPATFRAGRSARAFSTSSSTSLSAIAARGPDPRDVSATAGARRPAPTSLRTAPGAR